MSDNDEKEVSESQEEVKQENPTDAIYRRAGEAASRLATAHNMVLSITQDILTTSKASKGSSKKKLLKLAALASTLHQHSQAVYENLSLAVSMLTSRISASERFQEVLFRIIDKDGPNALEAFKKKFKDEHDKLIEEIQDANKERLEALKERREEAAADTLNAAVRAATTSDSVSEASGEACDSKIIQFPGS